MNIKYFLGSVLILSSISLVGFAYLASLPWFLEFGFYLAAIDLFLTVFWKPLFKPGPMAKMAYPQLTDEDGIL